jgi:hypothetical protein
VKVHSPVALMGMHRRRQAGIESLEWNAHRVDYGCQERR